MSDAAALHDAALHDAAPHDAARDDAARDDAGATAAAEPVAAEPAATVEPDAALDLDAIERDLADVEAALVRLDAGTYWTDEVTGEALPDELLAEHPTARRHDPR